MRKFFVNSNQVENEKIYIIGEDVNHIKNVLRLSEGEQLEISDEKFLYLCEIQEFEKERILLNIINKNELSETNVKITIFQGLPKADKMELIIQKGTELGISKYIPVKLSRCIVKLEGKDEIKKIDRWKKISEMAAKQSGRDLVPDVEHLNSLKEVTEKINSYDLFLVAFEEEKENTLKNELLKLKELKDEYKIAVLVGPEGGLAKEEVEILQKNGAKVITLGNRILRTETVAMYIASTIMYELEMN